MPTKLEILRLPRRLTLAGIVLIALTAGLAAAVWSLNTISLLPPKVEPRQVQVSGAATHLLVDAGSSWILDDKAQLNDFSSLIKRAEVFGNLIASPPVRELIGRRTGLRRDDIAAVVRLTAPAPGALRDPDSEQRANGIRLSKRLYRLDIQADPVRPILHLYAQAPTPPEAVRLANAAVAGLGDYLRRESVREGVDPRRQVRLEQLGPARGGVINGGVGPQIAILTFLVVFAVCCALLLVGRQVHRGWATAGSPTGPVRPALPLARRRGHARAAEGGDWPYTTRVLPWMLAGFMAVIWLVPFNTIELSASLPIDLQFDRLLLPFVVVTWLLVLAAGGRHAPRIRFTPIHAGIGLFVAIMFIGVVLDARYLNHTLEYDLATKKLTLLFLFMVVFLMVGSTVRRSELPAFFTYTLVLAVLCALGTIWEYRFSYNVFYDLPSKLLPGSFIVGQPETGLVDSGGRALTRGPGEHPLEAVAMMSLALPIAIVGILRASVRRERILYALAICVLVAASLSTYRKSALLAPVSVVLTLAYFRRADLLRLAPLAAVLLVIVQILSPGALTSILFQFKPEQLGASTVSDRAADYDAVRPDLWSHLAFGRGYGTYDGRSYRVLDSEILNRLVDSGVLGVLALVIMVAAVVLAARRLIRSRHALSLAAGLSVAPAAVAYLVLSFLFDVSSFPHGPYIFMCLAGLLAVAVASHDDVRSGTQRGDWEGKSAVVEDRSLAVAPRPPLGARAAHDAPALTTR